MARWFYTALFYLSLPLIIARLWWRGRRASAYRQRIGERFGFFSQSAPKHGIWIHAVSVGEVIAAAPLVRALQQRHPHIALIVTTMTPTGSERVRALFGTSVLHVYAPYDLPDCIERFLRRVQPRLLIIIETELWPNMIHGCAARGIPIVLANARLSERSARGYRKFAMVTAPMLRALRKVVAQNAEDGARFTALGLPAQNLVVSGSIKFDIALDAELIARAQQMHNELRGSGRFIWIAASTHAGEDEIVLQAHRQLREQRVDALLILVPRHPERFNDVATLIGKSGFDFVRRSAAQTIAGEVAVLLGDTMGELLFLYGCADCAFVGGSLVARGGHNTLEPAAWGLPIITGPSDFNFREISALLQHENALAVVSDAETLAEMLSDLATDATLRQQRGAAAKQVVANNRGALDKLIGEVDFYLRGE
jgi:3-deoxy-D-manno-octulosonic-acid transferase